MNQKILSLLALPLLLFVITSEAVTAEKANPTSPSLSGKVVDALDGAPFRDVNIWIIDQYSGNQTLVHPDKTGYYAVRLQEGYYFVLIGTGGYIPVCKSIWVRPGKPIEYSVSLLPDNENMIID
jgi:hypothetical protein